MASVDTINASSLFSSSLSLPLADGFDVFLSYTGSDTRNDFTVHLFGAMNQNGISTFGEDEILERGKSVVRELLIAIEEPKLAVVIFWEKYASSRWCLDELVEIVECMEKKNLKVLPIFHLVDPCDVANQTGAFADAFAKHEERFKDSIEDVNLWRLALRKAANIPGWVLNYGDPESRFIYELIGSLCNISNRMPAVGSTNWDSPPRFDVTPDESDGADDDADEVVQDYVADLPLIGQENESLSNLSNREAQLNEFIESHSNLSIEMLEDGSVNFNLPARVDDSQDEADNDADEMVPDCVTDLPPCPIGQIVGPSQIGQENESLSNLSNQEAQLNEFIESHSNLSIEMLEDGSVNFNLPARVDDSQDEADNDADEMVPDCVTDLPPIGQENESLSNLSNREAQLNEFIESHSNLSIEMLEDGSVNFNLPARVDDSQDEADNDADEMVPDCVTDLPPCPIGQIVGPSQIGQENESLSNLSNREAQLNEFIESHSNLSYGEVQLITNFIESLPDLTNQMLEDGSTNWNLSPRFDVTPDESDGADDDADEVVQDYVADLPLEAHLVPDDVADVPQEAHVVEDHVANLPQEAHVVEDHVANLQQLCPICDNAIGVAFCCGHMVCVECGDRCYTCPICRDRIHIRFRVFCLQ